MPLHLTQNIPISAISASRKTSISSGQVSERSCLPPAPTVEGQQVSALRLAYSRGFCMASRCFVVAMEEISWGQRLFGYRAPAYFLGHN